MKEFSSLEQYQYAGFQRLLTSVKLRCAGCLFSQILSFGYLHYDIQHSFCILNEKVAYQHQLTIKLISKQAKLTLLRALLLTLKEKVQIQTTANDCR